MSSIYWIGGLILHDKAYQKQNPMAETIMLYLPI